jgi:hypothetical protein
MTRRIMALLVTLTFGLLVAPLASEAQRPGTTPRIVYLSLAPGPQTVYSEAFVHGLRELGYAEGQHLILEYRWSAGHVEQL